MGKVVSCSVIVLDDFNNVLVAERGKGKKDSPKLWGIFGRALKGKENGEDCISKVIDKELGCTIFDLTPFREYVIDTETGDILQVYTGKIREMVSLYKEINRVKWINGFEADNLQFAEGDKNLILDYFNSIK
ncbi:MAG: hypothetical protein Q8930_08475 [Bacillota bacterium]|nr:hypothetical protein [Bacillota bacterium]